MGDRSVAAASGADLHLHLTVGDLLDFDLEASNVIDFAASPPTVTVSPFIYVAINPSDLASGYASGLLMSVDAASSTYTIDLEPLFYTGTKDFGSTTVGTDSQTFFAVNGATYTGPAGLQALDALPVGLVLDHQQHQLVARAGERCGDPADRSREEGIPEQAGARLRDRERDGGEGRDGPDPPAGHHRRETDRRQPRGRHDDPQVHELVRSVSRDRATSEVWEGAATLELSPAPGEEHDLLAPVEVGKGYRFSFGYTVDDLETVKEL